MTTTLAERPPPPLPDLGPWTFVGLATFDGKGPYVVLLDPGTRG